MDSAVAGGQHSCPQPLGQRCAFPTLTTAEGDEVFQSFRERDPKRDISIWAVRATSLTGFDRREVCPMGMRLVRAKQYSTPCKPHDQRVTSQKAAFCEVPPGAHLRRSARGR